MKSSQISIFILVTLILCGCQKEPKQKNKNKFSGLWTLHIMEQQDSLTGNWNEWRNGMQGYILYDDLDNMAVHLTAKGYQNTNIQFPNFIDTIFIEALKHLTQSYVYFAKYTVFEEESIVQHARISHSNPGDWSLVVRRKYTFKGDTLILEPVEQQNSSLRLKWIKSSEQQL